MASTWAFEAQGPGSIPGGGARIKRERDRSKLNRIGPGAQRGGELNQLDLAILLAAGEGKRMKSSRAKVLHEIAGRSLIAHVIRAVEPLAAKELRVVVGADKEDVIQHLSGVSPSAKTIYQEIRGGTGHAVKLALAGYNSSGTVLICAGDTPLLTSATLENYLKTIAQLEPAPLY